MISLVNNGRLGHSIAWMLQSLLAAKAKGFQAAKFLANKQVKSLFSIKDKTILGLGASVNTSGLSNCYLKPYIDRRRKATLYSNGVCGGAHAYHYYAVGQEFLTPM